MGHIDGLVVGSTGFSDDGDAEETSDGVADGADDGGKAGRIEGYVAGFNVGLDGSDEDKEFFRYSDGLSVE